MQVVRERRRSSADGMMLFLLWLVFRQGAVGTLRRLDRDRGNSGSLMPAFGGAWLQEAVERAGGSSADGTQHKGCRADPHR